MCFIRWANGQEMTKLSDFSALCFNIALGWCPQKWQLIGSDNSEDFQAAIPSLSITLPLMKSLGVRATLLCLSNATESLGPILYVTCEFAFVQPHWVCLYLLVILTLSWMED